MDGQCVGSTGGYGVSERDFPEMRRCGTEFLFHAAGAELRLLQGDKALAAGNGCAGTEGNPGGHDGCDAVLAFHGL